MSDFSFTCYGVRGSYPVAGAEFLKYGGNTSCLLCSTPDTNLILDAGTGIINLGRQLLAGRNMDREIHIFISHYHMDHIQGLPFFLPLYEPGCRVVIHAPPNPDSDGGSPLIHLFSSPLSPIGWESIKADVEFCGLKAGNVVPLSKTTRVETAFSATHPRDGIWLFRVGVNESSLVYATDVEFPLGMDAGIQRMCRETDVLVHDAQYLDNEYFDTSRPRKGFGHSTVSMAARDAIALDAARLFLFHYDPGHTDEILESNLEHCRTQFPSSFLARENQCIEIG